MPHSGAAENGAPIIGMDLGDIAQALREAVGSAQPAYRAKQVYQAIYRTGAADFVQISTLP